MPKQGTVHYRARLGMKQAELAEKAQIEVGRLSRIENGDVIPAPAEVDAIAAALGTVPNLLFTPAVLGAVAEKARDEAEVEA